MIRRVAGTVGRVALGLIAFLILNFVKNLAAALAFPFGGREFHAMFAYTGEGRLDVAWRVYLLYILTMAGAAQLLIALRFPLRPATVAWIAAFQAVLLWRPVIAWRPQSAEFHAVAVLLWWASPFLVFGSIAVTTRGMWPRTSKACSRASAEANQLGEPGVRAVPPSTAPPGQSASHDLPPSWTHGRRQSNRRA